MKYFYHHLIQIEDVTSLLDDHDLDQLEKEELLNLIDQIVHHHTLNIIFKHLPKDKHKAFLTAFHATPHDKQLLDYLKKEIKIDIESAIRTQADKIKKEILSEIKKSKA